MPLSAGEKHSLNAQLLQIEDGLTDIRQEEIQLAQRLSSLRIQRHALVLQRNRILNASHSTIYTLPNELLSLIFVFAVASGTVAPVLAQQRADIVSHVCHRWRDAAISTPSLWTHITMTEGPPYEQSAVHLERSGAYPIEVDIDLTRLQRFDIMEREFLTNSLVPQLYRARNFHLSSDRMEPFWLTLPRFTAKPALALEKFEVFHYANEKAMTNGVDGLWPEQEKREAVSAFGGEAPKLRSMTISGLHVPWHRFDISPGLREFAYDFHSTDVQRSAIAFFGVLRASRETLKVLTVMQAGTDLRISPNWFASTPAHPQPLLKRITLPNLDELVYTFAENGLACDLIRLVRTPNITSLTLEYIKNDSAALLEYMSCQPPLFPNLARLRLLGLKAIGPGRMLQFLRAACQKLTFLHLNANNCPTLKEIAFLVRWMALERQEYLMPLLQEISADGLTPRNLREMVQSRPEEIRPKKIVMRRRDWVDPADDCMEWLMEKVQVQFVAGSSDAEG